MRRSSFRARATVVIALLALATLSAASTDDSLAIPAGFDHWYLVNSTACNNEGQSAVQSNRRDPSHLHQLGRVRPG